ELAIPQLSDEQRKLVRSFALPVPSREIGLLTGSGFIRYSLLNMLVEHIRSSVPAEMLKPRQLQQVVK
ncbi:MAG TPA: hydrogen peroxide-inducible genes activator, partial [Prevotella sp.]